MDLVINHTSDEHPWFIEYVHLKITPKRVWYIWHDGQDGGSQTTGISIFLMVRRHAEYDEETEQYYLHLFSRNNQI
ncbi:hypothetical protein CW304_22705 [Bacillus sp. UFRGS-B20]|nr:hypothetical protein CW304_22705 [Bacillus sp. UFRGS-B20]